jgi:hypothetical protein
VIARAIAIASLALVACDLDRSQEPADARAAADAHVRPPDAPIGSPDAQEVPDAQPDAMPLPTDADQDGHIAEQDCDDHDPLVWLSLPYGYRDVDGDAYFVASSGTLCTGGTLPAGYASTAWSIDCDDTDPAIFTLRNGYVDADGDHYGDGAIVTLCTNGILPAGYAYSAGDCAPSDDTRWIDRAYDYRDVDGDKATVVESGTICSGDALPAGYTITAGPLDCNDHDPSVYALLTIYADQDKDGFGAGAASQVCALAPPTGYSKYKTDCDDADVTRWALLAYVGVDLDGDGVTAKATGTLCTAGALPPPYSATLTGNDCNDGDPSLTHYEVLYPDPDGNGIGSPPRAVMCIGASIPAGYSPYGWDGSVPDDDLDDLTIY